MNRPPMKAVEQIKRYCEKTQCRRCVYGEKEMIRFDDYVGCKLQLANPCEWDVKSEE